MGTFSAGAAPPLLQPGSLPSSSKSSSLRRKHSAFLGFGVETLSAVPPFNHPVDLLWVSAWEIDNAPTCKHVHCLIRAVPMLGGQT